MQEETQIILMLGRIQGTLDAVQKQMDGHSEVLFAMDGRLRTVERHAAVHGALGGGMAAMAVSALVQMIKARLELGG